MALLSPQKPVFSREMSVMSLLSSRHKASFMAAVAAAAAVAAVAARVWWSSEAQASA